MTMTLEDAKTIPPDDDAIAVDGGEYPMYQVWCNRQEWADKTVFIARSDSQFAACSVFDEDQPENTTEYIYNFAQWCRDASRDDIDLELVEQDDIPGAVLDVLLNTIAEKEGVVMESTIDSENPLSNPLNNDSE